MDVPTTAETLDFAYATGSTDAGGTTGWWRLAIRSGPNFEILTIVWESSVVSADQGWQTASIPLHNPSKDYDFRGQTIRIQPIMSEAAHLRLDTIWVKTGVAMWGATVPEQVVWSEPHATPSVPQDLPVNSTLAIRATEHNGILPNPEFMTGATGEMLPDITLDPQHLKVTTTPLTIPPGAETLRFSYQVGAIATESGSRSFSIRAIAHDGSVTILAPSFRRFGDPNNYDGTWGNVQQGAVDLHVLQNQTVSLEIATLDTTTRAQLTDIQLTHDVPGWSNTAVNLVNEIRTDADGQTATDPYVAIPANGRLLSDAITIPTTAQSLHLRAAGSYYLHVVILSGPTFSVQTEIGAPALGATWQDSVLPLVGGAYDFRGQTIRVLLRNQEGASRVDHLALLRMCLAGRGLVSLGIR